MTDSPARFQRVLVLRTGTLGDTVCAIPAFRLIRQNFPDAELTLLFDIPSGANVAAWDVVKNLGIFDSVVGYRTGSKIGAAWQLLRILRKIRPETLVQLPQGDRTPWQTANLRRYFRLVSAAKLIGFHPHIRSGEWEPNEADRLLQVLNNEGIGGGKPDYAIPVDWAALASVSARDLGIDLKQPYLVFCGGGKTATQQWPLERYAAVFRILCRELSIPVIGVGGPAELELYRRLIWPAFPECVIPDTAFSLAELFEVLRFATAYVGNDTGPMHVAASVDCPVLAVISARNRPGRFDPDAKQSRLVRHRTPCEGCRLDVCFENRHRCLLEIDVQRVLGESRTFLKSIEDGERQQRLESLRRSKGP